MQQIFVGEFMTGKKIQGAFLGDTTIRIDFADGSKLYIDSRTPIRISGTITKEVKTTIDENVEFVKP